MYTPSASPPVPPMRPVPPELQRALAARFGARASTLPHVRRLYGYDATGMLGVPDAVVHPCTEGDVVDAIAIAEQFGLPVVGRGSGTGLSGGSVPEHGGIVLTFEHMRHILAIDPHTFRARVEPGVVNQVLDEELRPVGMFYPPDPSSHRISSLGGNLAENSGGPRAVKYGVTGNHVASLRIVDASGRAGDLVAGERQPGMDLVSLVVGSEGTLALMVSAELNVEVRPQRVATLLVSFSAMSQATQFVSAVIADGLLPAALEFMDQRTIEKIEEWGVAQYAPGAQAVLLLDVDGTTEEITAVTERLRDLAVAMNALDLAVARDDVEREALWLGRRGSYAVLARLASRVLIQDVTVPRNRLTDMLLEVERIAERHNLQTATVGHAGDGNLHPDFPYNPDDPDLVARVHAANEEILRACVAMDGSITGEHGIGTDKLSQLPIMYGPVELGLMADVKSSLDPQLRLNPGKAVPLVPRAVPAAGGRPRARPDSAEAVQQGVLAARSRGLPLRMSLDGLRGISVDEDNMVVDVAAGETIDAIDEALSGTSLRLPVRPLRETSVARAVLLNDYGPNHFRQGLFRHCLLAATYVTGRGELVRMGRPVVKNVAGYDLFRPLIGSRGRLGVPASFTFRLTPRDDGQWYERILSLQDLLSLTAQVPRPLALFAVPGSGNWRVLIRLSSPLEGWFSAHDAPALLLPFRAGSSKFDDALDLAVSPGDLDAVVQDLPVPPLALLPAAARLLVRMEREGAIDLVGRLRRRGCANIRAVYGSDREPIGDATDLAAEWERRLRHVFDPDAILADWLFAS